MLDYGIKVSRPGYDASIIPNSNDNIKKLSLWSGSKLLKIKTSAKVNLTSTGSVTIAHGLSYRPIFWVFKDTGAKIIPIYDTVTGTRAYIDATNLTIVNNDVSAKDFYYYIFYDPA